MKSWADTSSAANPTAAGEIAADLVSLIPLLAAAYGVVLGIVALSLGWELFRGRPPARFRRGGQVPPEVATGPDPGGGR